MEHVTIEDINHAKSGIESAQAAYKAARDAEETARAQMVSDCGIGPISRKKDHPSYAAWMEKVIERDARDKDLTSARRLLDALRNQRLKYLARLVSIALLEKCSGLNGKPCRYKRVKNAVKAACSDIDGARVELYDKGQLVVYDARDDSRDGIDLYPSKYDVSSGDELFCTCYLENYISDNDGICGMLAHIFGAAEIRNMVDVFDDRLRDVCDQIGAAHDAARQLADTYKAIGLSQDVETASKRAVY